MGAFQKILPEMFLGSSQGSKAPQATWRWEKKGFDFPHNTLTWETDVKNLDSTAQICVSPAVNDCYVW